MNAYYTKEHSGPWRSVIMSSLPGGERDHPGGMGSPQEVKARQSYVSGRLNSDLMLQNWLQLQGFKELLHPPKPSYTTQNDHVVSAANVFFM